MKLFPLRKLFQSALLAFAGSLVLPMTLDAEPLVLDLWPDEKMPGPASLTEGEERDLTKPEDKLIAGKPIIKLGHVATPQMHVYLPPEEKRTGSAILVCPGGGFHILAWDLEGVEVAEWLNELGIVAVVLKYRVPTAPHGREPTSLPDVEGPLIPANSLGPVADAQRALSLMHERAAEWRLDAGKIGILGFSAGGATAALTALSEGVRVYPPIDEVDRKPCDADFGMLIYPGGLADEETGQLKPYLSIRESSPSMFFVHAADDRVTCLSSTALFSALKLAGVPAELHVYQTGGHGYGLRRTDEAVTSWTERASEWMKGRGLLEERR